MSTNDLGHFAGSVLLLLDLDSSYMYSHVLSAQAGAVSSTGTWQQPLLLTGCVGGRERRGKEAAVNNENILEEKITRLLWGQ